ncbi:MAG: exodeoxyribonuclease large subunit [Actinomycetota bacterium]|jgi:exodeoxyribonuclease VII large subunit|nr:exodeoxyribonuclease large subunit [Actinomycetota bacterium]
MSLFSDSAANGPRRVSLIKLSAEIARAMAAVGRIEIEGEVASARVRPSGGVFFVLRDRNAQLRVWCKGAKARRTRIADGERVSVVGRLIWANDRGDLSLDADEVNPVGEGAIAAAIAERRVRLEAEGLLARPRRRLPVLPRRVGVVCGADAAVRKDIESVVAVRFPHYPVEFVEVPVSGTGAAESIRGALEMLDASGEVDVIILARGGGDATHLLPFSDEGLCRAIAASGTPVVSAIGHEGDRPLCDEVADLRCGTPSIAAAAVIPSLVDLESELAALLLRASSTAVSVVGRAGLRLEAIDRERALTAGLGVAADRLGRQRFRLDQVRLDRRVGEHRRRLGDVHLRLEALSPARVLERGYAVVRTADGAVVRSSSGVAVGDRLLVTVASGRLGASVDEVVA